MERKQRGGVPKFLTVLEFALPEIPHSHGYPIIPPPKPRGFGGRAVRTLFSKRENPASAAAASLLSSSRDWPRAWKLFLKVSFCLFMLLAQRSMSLAIWERKKGHLSTGVPRRHTREAPTWRSSYQQKIRERLRKKAKPRESIWSELFFVH